MLKAVIKVFLVLLATQGMCLCQGTAAVDGSCKQANDFEKEKCGEEGSANFAGLTGYGITCCGSRQTCVGPVSIKVASVGEYNAYQCSTERQLSGTKAIKIVLTPLFFLLMDIFFVIYMVLKLNIKGNHVTKVCVAVIALSWPLLLSSGFAYGVYAGFLAVFVAFMSNSDGFPWWIYRLAWAMQVFQVVMLFGPNEVFHVPIFNQSLAGTSSHLIRGFLGHDESGCNQHYEQFFKLLDIEKMGKEADPDTAYYGYCTIGWLGFVQGTLMLQGILWMVMVLLSAPVFLTDTGRSSQSADSKIQPDGDDDADKVKAF